MVVDDSADMVDTISEYLGRNGFEVEPVTAARSPCDVSRAAAATWC